MITSSSLGNNGHLGNQMFQYASLRGIAHNRGFDWAIPPAESFGSRYNVRSSIYDCFTLGSVSNNNITTDFPTDQFSERQFNFDSDLFENCQDNIDMHGYFQTERYFKDIAESIKEDFSFKSDIEQAANEIFNGMPPDTFTSIHIRRSDYIGNDAYHTNIQTDYYYDIIDNIADIDNIIIFSDDIDWCRANINFSEKSNILFSSNAPYVDLCAMSMCRINIIANSSFSWWAAWLNSNKDKKVFAPTNWFGPANSHLNTEDLIPNNWIIK